MYAYQGRWSASRSERALRRPRQKPSDQPGGADGERRRQAVRFYPWLSTDILAQVPEQAPFGIRLEFVDLSVSFLPPKREKDQHLLVFLKDGAEGGI